MNKFIVLGLLTLFVFSSCSSSDDADSSSNPDFLIGTWEAVEEYDFYNGDGTFTYEPGEDRMKFTNDRISFYSYEDLMYSVEYKYNPSTNELIAGSYVIIIETQGADKFIWWNERKDLGSLYKRVD